MIEKHYISKLSAFVDRELPKDEQQVIAGHLLVCTRCRQEHDRIKFAAGLASKLEHPVPPPSVWSAIEAGLDRKQPVRRVASIKHSIFSLPVFASFSVAAIFLVAFISISYYFLTTGEPYQARQDRAESPGPGPLSNSLPSVNANGVRLAVAENTNTNSANVAAAPNPVVSPSQSSILAQAFEFETLAGNPKVGSLSTNNSLAVGDYLETDAASKARIEVADIGNVEIRPNSRIKLVGTGPKQHRLALERGSLHARILAPPRLFIVDTPTATAVDLGCEYTLDVDNEGNNRLHVTSGFVALERGGRESIVPAGAICLTKKGKGLGTPFSAETSDEFRTALESFDFGGGGSAAVQVLLEKRNFYDIITLWHLLSRVSRTDREKVYDALAAYVSVPDGVTRDGIMKLNKIMLESWRTEVERVWFE
jgi:hypothetical protein